MLWYKPLEQGCFKPANRPEEDSAADLNADIERFKRSIGGLYIDRGYINAPLVAEVEQAGRVPVEHILAHAGR